MPFPPLEQALQKYQDPAEADKITKIQKDLEETKQVLYNTIDAVLARGEKLDDLIEKSDSLSMQSKKFYKTAKKHNQCCVVAWLLNQKISSLVFYRRRWCDSRGNYKTELCNGLTILFEYFGFWMFVPDLHCRDKVDVVSNWWKRPMRMRVCLQVFFFLIAGHPLATDVRAGEAPKKPQVSQPRIGASRRIGYCDAV